MAQLLVVHHSPTPAVQALTDAVLAGANHEDIEGVEVVVKQALEATIDDVLAADGYLLGTTANFGYMSGALKHFFDTTFNVASKETQKRPFAFYVHGGTDTTGAVRSVLSITTGLGWEQVAPELAIVGDVTDKHKEQAMELGGTIAARLMN